MRRRRIGKIDIYDKRQKTGIQKTFKPAKSRYIEKRKDIPMKVFCDTFDVSKPQEIEPRRSSGRKK